VHTERSGIDEPWQLDLLPLILGSEEWRELEAGLIQRALLLNLVLGDLYGTQRLVRDGFVPAPLVFANPAYLRPCQALAVKDKTFLMTYSADLARSGDGRWWVIADRTQAPVGFGFAMQNRAVLSRVLPEVMREFQPRPILDTLRVRREALRHFSPRHTDNPAIALLTSGPRNEAYFEHAYLSRLLGLTLVEGDDLTVRDRRLWVKTLNGLRRVDVLLRRVSDAFCDPLELRGDSLLGVPGLLEAARAGNVSVGNAVGTGLLEGPAFMPFLPGLCRHLLGEELRLPSPATWWCGQAREQSYVRDHLRGLVIRSAFTPAGPAFTPSELDTAGEAALLERIRQSPHEFIGQEQVRLSRAPVLTAQEMNSKPFVLRVFVVHTGSEFAVMPGGLARVLETDGDGMRPIPLVGLSKDVWVLPEGAGASPQPHNVSAPLPHIEGASSDVPSRAADNLFWLGRYTERLEEIVRAARYALGCVGEDTYSSSQSRLGPLQGILGHLGLVATPSHAVTRESFTQDLLSLVYDEEPADGVRDLLQRLHLAAFRVRDRLSTDTWHLLNRLKTHARPRPGGLPLVEASGTLHALVLDLAAFSGMEMENMTRGHGWVFLDMGRRIERGIFIATLMEAIWRSGPGLEWVVEPALEIADSVMTHRRRYFTEPRLSSVMEVLVEDASNPRSLAFQVACLKEHAALLPTGQNPEGVAALRILVGQIDACLGRISQAGAGDATTAGELVPSACAEIAGRLAALSESLTEVYFSHVSSRVS
jgi:uncharacterized circularly permuted ATP-grasp superfamily protein/uncharacterized alpha-E superfamily protein